MGKWLKNIAVTVGQNLNSMKHCSKFKGPGKNGQVIELTCKSPIAGRYVKILRSGKGILGLAEVQVMGNTGKQLIPAKPKGKIVKPAKPKGQQCIMNPRGANYGGNISKTRSGRTCQAWGVQTPQKHKFSKKLADQKNYCRNPDNEPYGPWCYTTDAKKRWEYCAIPYCRKEIRRTKRNVQVLKRAKRSADDDLLLGEDLALGLEAKQSSWARRYAYVSQNGMDGVTDSLVETQRGQNPYWTVQLPKEEKIKGVVFINRVDCCGARFNNIQVMIGGKECATFKGPGEKGEIIPLRCSHPLTGKKVEVLLKGNGILSFAEIKIIAAEDADTEEFIDKAFKKNLKPDDFYAVLEKDVKPSERKDDQTIGLKKVALRADGYTTEQISSLSRDTTDDKGVDGSIHTYAHTKKQLDPWWIVDLTKNYKVKKIKVLSRTSKAGGGQNFKMVTALVGPDKENMKECGSFKGPAKRSQFITFNCKEPVNGKFVKLQSKGINSLSFAELQVYAIH
ncbi:Hypothetical predicted protein [Mytilus galloprovincialis]|uniref:Kringle domain-containing protein n=1 Tax=Mytilus galloprovincialis TaxID=29158 RepID=A0A8B6E2B6_MYTGA|nr:Hypothetical predicted protein [Mytilus galloprovincialis]